MLEMAMFLHLWISYHPLLAPTFANLRVRGKRGLNNF